MMLCAGSSSALAQETPVSEAVCVDATVIRQCETDARKADDYDTKAKEAKTERENANRCQRQLDTTDGSLQECQRVEARADERHAARMERVTREAARATVEAERRPEWAHVAMMVAGTLLVGIGTGYILGGL
jgi:hypothetical protein